MFSYSISGSPMTSCEDICEAYEAIERASPYDAANNCHRAPHYVIWEHNANGTLSLADANGDE